MFNIQEDHTTIRFEINSEMRHVDRIVRETREFLEQLDLEISSDFKIVLRELLINAIEHGNHSHSDRTVSCSLEQLEKKLFKLIVEDQGEGFDFDSLEMEIPQDPRQVRNRGYVLIRSSSEKIEFNEKGNQVTVYLLLEAETQFAVSQEDDWNIICPSGNITAAVADKFRILLNDLIQQDHFKYRFDLSNVDDLDSVSLSVLVVLSKMLSDKKKGDSLEITNAKPDLMNLFRMMSLDKIYKISEPSAE